MQIMYDVIIVGAGPAGTAAAYDLLTADLRVLLLDKTGFPRKKACAGGITPKALQLFRYDISPVIQRTCKTVHIRGKHHKKFNIENQNTLCYMTDRKDLDAYCLDQVLQKKADFRITQKIYAVEQGESGVCLRCDIGTFRARYLIGADGANSRIRRITRMQGSWVKQAALEADVKTARPDRLKMTLDFSLIKNGYFWIFPKKDHVNIGVYQTARTNRFSSRLLQDYAAERLNSNRLTSIRGYPICSGGSRSLPVSKRILLTGDAAGFAEPLLGEGIYFAVKSGQLAAAGIFQALEKNPASAAQIYYRLLKSFRRDLQIYNFASKCFYRFPSISLSLLSAKMVHTLFSNGYADGRTLCGMLGLDRTVKNKFK